MCCDSRMSRRVAMSLVALLSLVLAACGGGGGGGGSTGATNYTVTATAGAGGNISPTSATVSSGATTSFTVTPDSGNSINTVSGCGGALVGTTYTTGAVSADCTVTANFVSNGVPTISVADASVSEGDSGTTTLNFTVTLSALANGNVNVDFATSDNSPTAGSATAGSDYTASSGTLTIPAGSTSATIGVSVTGDTAVESDEIFALTLSNPSGNATLGTATATGTILNDEIMTRALNDTGITVCWDGSTFGLTCPQAGYPGQDAEYGRDVTVNDDSDGHAGFSFTKLDSSGNPLAVQSVDYTTTPWDCVRDNITGLSWEVKTTDGGLRHWLHRYSWYNSTGINDGGDPGTANGGVCVDSSNCDTEKYVAAVNAVGLCGQTDWRMPTVEELSSLLDGSFNDNIDSNYFPNSVGSYYWSSSSRVAASLAWYVKFDYGEIYNYAKSIGTRVRLVREAP